MRAIAVGGKAKLLAASHISTTDAVRSTITAAVKAGQDVAEIESEKAVQTVPAPEDGVLRQVAAEGQVVPVLNVIGTVD